MKTKVPGHVKTRAKRSPFNKGVQIWMRPEAHHALRGLAWKRKTTIQALIDDLIHCAAADDPTIAFSPHAKADALAQSP